MRFLEKKKQIVVVNGGHSSWADLLAGVPERSILGLLLSLIYINDLPNGLLCNVKHFADDTSLFSIVYNKHDSAAQFNNDLTKIKNWAYKWKTSFHHDPSKQVQDKIFSRKLK